MTREELIRECRYYTGEEKNPFESEGGTKSLLWGYEKVWINASISDKEYLDDCLQRYENEGLGQFNENDNIPITLKALLFNRFCHWNAFGIGVVEDFKEWYNEYY